MDKNNSGSDRPESYPKPSETDSQLANQPEYIDQEPNKIDKEISDVPEDAFSKRGGDNSGDTIGNP